jgi:transposase
MPALAIRRDLSPSELRRLAPFELDRRASMRLLAIANALEGMSRADAARLAGMERQALRDAVLRYNAEGPEGLHDRPRSGRPEGLSEGQQAALKAWVLPTPRCRQRGDPEARPQPGAGRGERLAAGRHLRSCREGLWRALQRMGHVAPPKASGAIASEGAATASAGQPGRAGRVQKMGLGRGSPRSARRTPTGGSSSGARMRPGSGRRAASAIAGTSAASARPGWLTSGTTASISSPPADRAPTRPSRWPYRGPRPKPWPCSSPPSRSNWPPACTPSFCSTRLAGTSRRSSSCPTTSRSCRCQPAAPS